MLLLVKRWVGQLPTKRTALYDKAVEVLLMTWNVEAHRELDKDEVVPQLAYVAFYMMQNGIQQITGEALKRIIILARKEMPEILCYTSLTPAQLIEKVELRSSLFMLAGHKEEDGRIQPVYEFRHLTFQEYLTAIAVAEGFYPGRKEEDTIADVLRPYLEDEDWKEVVPLAAVLSGRKVRPLVDELTGMVEALVEKKRERLRKNELPIYLLAQCIADEINVSPDVVKRACVCIVKTFFTIVNNSFKQQNLIQLIYNTKFKEIIKTEIIDFYKKTESFLESAGAALLSIGLIDIGFTKPEAISTVIFKKINEYIETGEPVINAAGVLVLMYITFQFVVYSDKIKNKITKKDWVLENILDLGNRAVTHLYSDLPYLHFAAAWLIAWLGETYQWHPENPQQLFGRLLEIWRTTNREQVKRQVCWGISLFPLMNRDDFKITPDPGIIDFIKKKKQSKIQFEFEAALILGFYLHTPWDDTELVTLLEKASFRRNTLRRKKVLFEQMGDVAKKALKELKLK